MSTLLYLNSQNPWWNDDRYQIEEKSWFKRDLFYEISKNLKHPLILNIIGLRRVGKSTILKQIITSLLNEQIKAKNIFYFLFDYYHQPKTLDFLEEILEIYFKEVLDTKINKLNEIIYIFLDEIQYIENWERVLKRYYDLSNKKIKFILTGSQSVLLKEKSKESLAGRIFDFYLPPMSFLEFLGVNSIDIKTIEFDIFKLPEKYFDLTSYYFENSKKIYNLSRDYILYGQFPECNLFDTNRQKYEYIMESVFGKTLEDAIKIYQIDKANEFKLTAYQLLNNVGSIFELQNIGREVALSKITLEKYFDYFKKSYIFNVLYKYNKSLIKKGRTLKKLYLECINFASAFNKYHKEYIEEAPEIFGKIIENLIFNILRYEYEDRILSNNLSFIRQGNNEIDFLVCNKKTKIPIEVKFAKNITNSDLDYLVDFVCEKNLEYGIMITRDVFDKKQIMGKTIYMIPYYLMFFLVKN